jgi:PAS domain S-box-containing protein
MERLPNDKPYIIYLSHQDKEFEKKLKDIIMNNIHNVEVRIAKVRADIPIDPNVSQADLIILDVYFDDIELMERAEAGLEKIYDRNSPPPPFLVLIDAENFDPKKLSFVDAYPDVYFDFYDQKHFYDFIFCNRIKVLLSIPKILKLSKYQKTELQKNLWMALDYSNVYIVILDSDFKVVLCNHHLARSLGFKNEDEVIGQEWSKFLGPVEREVVTYVQSEILKGSKKYEEFTNDIFPVNNKPITVKWFNTLINNNFNCAFSIGIPLTKEPDITADVDTIRAYFTDIIKRDRTTINAMKEVTTKYSNIILGKSEDKPNNGGKCS